MSVVSLRHNDNGKFMEKINEVLKYLEEKYGRIEVEVQYEGGCPTFIYDDDCTWGCKGNAMGN